MQVAAELKPVPPTVCPNPDEVLDQADAIRDQRTDEIGRDAGLHAVNVEDFLQLKIAPREYVLEPIIREKDSAMIYSWRGTGKTHFGLSLSYAIASGGKCLKWTAPKPRRVLYIDGEMPASSMQDRLLAIIAASDQEPPSSDYLRIITLDLQDLPVPSLSSRESQNVIDELTKETDVIVLDSISTLFRGGRENEAESWLPAQEWCLRLRRRGLCVVLLHHEGKGGAQRGTSRREDTLDTVIHLVRPHDYVAADGARFEIHFEKARGLFGDAVKPFEARLEVRDGRADWTIKEIEDAKLALASEMFKNKLSVRDVAEELRISKSAAGRLRAKFENGNA